MERAINTDERIRRAEEIYQRRREQNYRTNQARVNVSGKNNDYKLFKKIFLQITACLLIYFAVYIVKNSDYIFSEAFLKHVKEILTYDIDVTEIYNNAYAWFMDMDDQEEKEKSTIPPAEETDLQEKEVEESQEESEQTEDKKEETQKEEVPKEETQKEEILSATEESSSISEAMSDADYIKENYSLIKPLNGTITSRFGVRNPTTPTVPKYHTGIDIAANTGTKFIAAMTGKVVQVSSEGDYWNHIKIKKDDIYTLYAHCNNIYVKEGDEISQGQEIGEVGETGNATGPHLHFEIRREDRFVNPDDVLVF